MVRFAELLKTAAYADIRRQLIACKLELTQKHARLRSQLPQRHSDPSFDKRILSYVNSLRSMRKKYKPTVNKIADQIYEICADKPDWGNDPLIVGLWYELADVTRTFSFNVDKKNAALLVNNKGRLIGWDVSRTPKGIPRTSVCFKKGKRSKFNLCAEAILLANVNRQTITPVDGVDADMVREVWLLKRRGMDADEIRHSRAAAGLGPDTMGLYIVATTPPCEECSRAIVANYDAGVVVGMITSSHLSKEQRLQYTRNVKVHRRIARRIPTHRVRVNEDNDNGLIPHQPHYVGYFKTKKWGQEWLSKAVKPSRHAAVKRSVPAAQ